MLKVYLIVFVLCVMSLGVLGGRTKHENNRTGISLYDKFQQHDYKYDFERVEVLRYNKHYMKQCHAVTFKYNRTCAVVNITFEYNMNVGYDVEVIIQGYKFASNEYRLFPIRFEMNMCRALSKNIMGFADLQKGCGNFTGCPFLKGKMFKACNWKPNPEKFPPFIPNGQYMLEFQGMHRSIELWVMRSYGTVSRPIAIPQK